MSQGSAGGFSLSLMAHLAGQWDSWGKGISPGRSPIGYGGMNPYLLLAFGAFDRAKGRAERTVRKHAEAAARQQQRRR